MCGQCITLLGRLYETFIIVTSNLLIIAFFTLKEKTCYFSLSRPIAIIFSFFFFDFVRNHFLKQLQLIGIANNFQFTYFGILVDKT